MALGEQRRLRGVASPSVPGWCTGMARSSATRLTGEGRSCSPRPRGRSGCVRTSETVKPASTSVASTCAANAGVPAKPTFMTEWPPPLSARPAARRALSAPAGAATPGRRPQDAEGWSREAGCGEAAHSERGGRSSTREPLLLAQPRREPRLLQRGEMVDEDLAEKMLGLVLYANREHAVARRARKVRRAHRAHARGPARRAVTLS